MRRDEFARHVHSYTSDYTKFADGKAGFGLAASGALLTLVSQITKDWHQMDVGSATLLDIFRGVLLFSFFLFDGGALICCLRAITASTVGDRSSLVSFPSISEMGHTKHYHRVLRASPEDLDKQLLQHASELSTIAMLKYRWVNRAIRALGVAVALSLMICLTRA